MINLRNTVLIVSISVIITIAYSFKNAVAAEQSDLPELVLSSGLGGFFWNPGDVSPYQLDKYSRGYLFIEAKLQNPFYFLGESYNVIDFPKITMATDLNSWRSLEDRGDAAEANDYYAYIHGELDLVLFNFLSTRMISQKYYSRFTFAGNFFSGDTGSVNYSVISPQVRLSKLEVGLIGTNDGLSSETTLEIGYSIIRCNNPLVLSLEGRNSLPQLFTPELRFSGIYLLASSNPVPNVFPLDSNFRVEFANGTAQTSVGSDLYRAFLNNGEERIIKYAEASMELLFNELRYKKVQVGVGFNMEYRFFNSNYSSTDGFTYPLDFIDRRISFKLSFSYKVNLI
ncbi:hypothetical protein ACFLQJ_01345 [Calditrichota bacterium]